MSKTFLTRCPRPEPWHRITPATNVPCPPYGRISAAPVARAGHPGSPVDAAQPPAVGHGIAPASSRCRRSRPVPRRRRCPGRCPGTARAVVHLLRLRWPGSRAGSPSRGRWSPRDWASRFPRPASRRSASSSLTQAPAAAGLGSRRIAILSRPHAPSARRSPDSPGTVARAAGSPMNGSSWPPHRPEPRSAVPSIDPKVLLANQELVLGVHVLDASRPRCARRRCRSPFAARTPRRCMACLGS